MNYLDLNLSMGLTIKNDISVIVGIENCVRNELYNNLMISSREIPFSMIFKPNINDVIHSDSILTYDMQIRDTFEYVCNQDERIQSIQNINIVRNNDYEVVVDVTLQLKNVRGTTTFSFQITKG